MTRYFEEVSVGESLPPFERIGNLESWNRFAAVNDEFMPVHMDHEAAKARGERDVFGPGNVRFAHLHCMLRSWMGEGGWIRYIKCQHRGVNFKGDLSIAKGSVDATRAADGEHLVDLVLWVENQHGERLDDARATVVLPSREG